MKVVSVAVITFDNTVKNNVLGFGDYAFTLIFSGVCDKLSNERLITKY
jgi:hypothetical protein